MIENIDSILNYIHEKRPLIHCITNPISINDCANAVLALGARPIMAEHPLEVSGITATADVLCLNLGNITDARIQSIMTAGKTAARNGVPIILDLVGITCSDLRLDFARKFLSQINPAVIKGNLSEIKKIANVSTSFVGIDSTDNSDSDEALEENSSIVSVVSKKYNSVVAASGENDIISDGEQTIICRNGSRYLPYVTGTGCLQTVIIGTMLAAPDSSVIDKAVLGAAILGICGEKAEKACTENGRLIGLGTFHIKLIDAISTISAEDINKSIKLKTFPE